MQQVEADLWAEFEQEQSKITDFDITKLELSTEDNGILDIFFKKFLDPAETFPEGARHTTLEKNFAIYIVKNKMPLDQIKEAYKSKGFNINSLLSQIQGVTGGTYKNPHVNIGELVNWCKANRPDLVQLFADLKEFDDSKIIKRSDLIFPTEHLPIYLNVEKLTQIYGNEYKHLKKMLCYHITSGAIPKAMLCVQNGQIEIDLRSFLALVYPSGGAKGNVFNFSKKLGKDTNRKVIPLMSFHEEQLVGKILKRTEEFQYVDDKGKKKTKKRDKYIANAGHFISDELLFDESKYILLDRDKEASRNYLLKGMDKYGQNEIYKRMTENLDNPDEILSYYPHFNAIFGTQPFNFHEEKIALNGFLKRVVCDYLHDLKRNDDLFDDRLKDKSSLNKHNDELVQYLLSVNNLASIEWTFSTDYDDKFKELFRALRYAGLNNTSKKRNYTILIEWTLQDRLLRKSCLYALMKTQKSHVTAEHLELAFIDVLEDFIIELEFVNDKIYGNLDYGNVWGTSDKKEESVLKYLYQYGATSEQESTITIKELQQEIRTIYKVGEEQAKKLYYKLINKDLIKSQQVGSHGSKVWLIALPLVEGSKGGKGSNAVESKKVYLDLIKKHFGDVGGKGSNALGDKND